MNESRLRKQKQKWKLPKLESCTVRPWSLNWSLEKDLSQYLSVYSNASASMASINWWWWRHLQNERFLDRRITFTCRRRSDSLKKRIGEAEEFCWLMQSACVGLMVQFWFLQFWNPKEEWKGGWRCGICERVSVSRCEKAGARYIGSRGVCQGPGDRCRVDLLNCIFNTKNKIQYKLVKINYKIISKLFVNILNTLT